MKIIALDQSLRSTGVCILSDGRLTFKIIGAPSHIKEPLQQLKYTLYALQEVILQEQPDTVIVEGLPYGLNSTSVRPLAALYFHLLLFFDYWQFDYEVINITQAKKTAGKGSFSKEEMFELIPNNIKKIIQSTVRTKKQRLDLSDSYWLLQTYLQKAEE